MKKEGQIKDLRVMAILFSKRIKWRHFILLELSCLIFYYVFLVVGCEKTCVDDIAYILGCISFVVLTARFILIRALEETAK